MENKVPKGYCQCGCGQKTNIMPHSHAKTNMVKCEPFKFIHGHAARITTPTGKDHPWWTGGKAISDKGYILVRMPEYPNATKNGYVPEHILIVEKVMGKRLPKGAEIHHIDGNPTNNEPSNLLVCESRAYHHFIHQRTRAYLACGKVHWLKCKYCKRYDAPENLYVPKGGSGAYHNSCGNKRRKK